MHDSSQRKSSESYRRIIDAIVIKIQKTFTNATDVAKSLETGIRKVYVEPIQRAVSREGTEADIARREKLADKKWEIEYTRYLAKQEEFDHLWVKAYSLIWDSYCSKEIQVALQELPDFSKKIKRDPLELLQRIKKLMHTPEKAKYPSLTMVEILSNFLRCKQGDKESLLDYLTRFKCERDVIYKLWSKRFLDGYCENLPEWDNEWSETEKEDFCKGEREKFIAILFLRNANYHQYNDLLVDYRMSFANRQDIYPKKLEEAVDVMRQVPKKKKKSSRDPKPAKDETEVETSNATDVKKEEAACYCCGKAECRTWRCLKKDKLAPKDWHKPEHAPKDGGKKQTEQSLS